MSVSKKLVQLGNKMLLPGFNPGSSAGNGLSIDSLGYESLIVNLSVGTMTSATSLATLQHSNSSTSGFEDYQIGGSDVVTDTLDTTNTNTSRIIDISGARRYLRFVVTETGTVSDFNVSVLLDDRQYGEGWENETQYTQDY